LPQLMQLSEK